MHAFLAEVWRGLATAKHGPTDQAREARTLLIATCERYQGLSWDSRLASIADAVVMEIAAVMRRASLRPDQLLIAFATAFNPRVAPAQMALARIARGSPRRQAAARLGIETIGARPIGAQPTDAQDSGAQPAAGAQSDGAQSDGAQPVGAQPVELKVLPERPTLLRLANEAAAAADVPAAAGPAAAEPAAAPPRDPELKTGWYLVSRSPPRAPVRLPPYDRVRPGSAARAAAALDRLRACDEAARPGPAALIAAALDVA